MLLPPGQKKHKTPPIEGDSVARYRVPAPHGTLPSTGCLLLAALSGEQRLEQRLHLPGGGFICSTADPLSCWRALKIREGSGERVSEAPAAAAEGCYSRAAIHGGV